MINQKHTLILTATERLAKHLKETHPDAEVLSLNRWLENRWRKCAPAHFLLLNPSQEHALWEGNTLAQKAWYLLNQWDLSLDILKDETAPEVQFFYQLAKKYSQKCQNNHWVDRSQLARLIPLPSKEQTISLAGFEAIPPAIQTLFNKTQLPYFMRHSLPDGVSKGEHWDAPLWSPSARTCSASAKSYQERVSLPRNSWKIGLANQEQEIYTAAIWAKQRLKEAPHARIACVIPLLSQLREEVIQIFNETLVSPFNISLGQPLSHFPMIHIALQGLTLDPDINPIETISELLYSPFIGDSAQFAYFAEIDAKLYSNFETQVFMQELPSHITQSARMAKTAPEKQAPSAWVKQFKEQLETLGWPGTRTLNSNEYQTLQRFQALLHEFSSLDAVTPLFNRKQALTYLIHIAKKIIYQPENSHPKEPAIHILGSLEAAGLSFDFMWVMSMDSDAWPPPADPNPFLPIHLQKQLSMPQASAKQQLNFTRRLTTRLQQENNHVIFSYAKKLEDQDLTPSLLLNNIPEISFTELNIPLEISYITQIYEARKIEILNDNYGPSVQENENIRGGTAILKEQAACPFKAFASLRLHADEIAPPQLGLHAMERGKIMHSVLERLWHYLKSHHRLCSLEQNIIDQFIYDSIDITLNKFKKQKPYTFNTYFMTIERERLFYIITKWLNVEKFRDPFKVISKELRKQIKLNYLTINLQIDRIDELEDGSQLIIDYKTGQCSLNDWFGERPNEPQLPLYCITHSSPIDGIFFGQIRSNKMDYKGLIHPENWETLQTEWKTVLFRLEKDFYEGLAIVDPKEGNQTCQKCTLQTLCRIGEKSL